MRLIELLGGSIEEQIAGLLHDISHTAFSHVVDQVVFNEGETFHEEYRDWLMHQSGIPEILADSGLDINYVLDEHNWKILEQSAPDLCADRIDYTLRDLLGNGHITKSEIDRFVSSLVFTEGKIAVTALTQAIWFTEQYYYEVAGLFMDPIEIYANNELATVIREAIAFDVISLHDMLLDDDKGIIDRILASGQVNIISRLNDINPSIEIVLDKENFDYQGKAKARIVDPLVLTGTGELVRTSILDPRVLSWHANVKEKAAAGIFVKKVDSQAL